MTIVIDANVAVAILSAADAFHHVALRRCIAAGDSLILNLTHAEALIHPTRVERLAECEAVLADIGVEVVVLDNAVASRATQLRATYGNRNFPMVDAAVVALGIERGCAVVTCDGKWPIIHEAVVEVLVPTSP